MENLRLLKQDKKGFTLQEMLYVIAILLIVMSIAVPTVTTIRKNLQISELDDTARQIYLIAQNKLTTMKATGTLVNLNTALEDRYPAQKLGVIGLCPQDYTLEDDGWKNLYALNNTDEIVTQSIMGDGSILISSLDGSSEFMIELNPETGDVYGVFYSKSSFDYNDVNSEGLPTRERSDRKDIMVGYYGGPSELSASSETPAEFLPSIEVVNKEDLYIKVTCSNMRDYIKNQRYLIATITITDESYVSGDETNHIWTTDLNGGTDLWIKNDTLSFEYLLDSIRGDRESFNEITKGKLNPGDNIKITVSMSYSYKGVSVSGADSVTSNSLFSSKDANGHISVNTVRHLNNLRESIYQYDKDKNITIAQTSDIDFNSETWPSDSIIEGKAFENPLKNSGFSPIKNQNLLNQLTFNGNNNRILNFDLSGTDNIGIFGRLDNCTIVNAVFVNCTANGRNNVGTLAGQMNGGTVKNCSVYIATEDEYQRPLTDMDSRVARYKVKATGSNAGGLIGRASGYVSVSDSFAAVEVSGASNVGGLIGTQQSGSVIRCYSSGSVAANTRAGGLVGSSGTSGINHCYSTSNVITSDCGGGIVGYAGGGTISNSTAYGKISKGDGTYDLSASGGIYGSGSVSLSGCKYLSYSNYNAEYTPPYGTSACGYSELKTSVNNSRNHSHPYAEKLTDTLFPFSLLRDENNHIINHYGDWPSELKLQTSLIYYEKYASADKSGNHYGYYTETSLISDENTEKPNQWKIDTLRDDVCIEDGYALASIHSLTSFTYILNEDLNTAASAQTIFIDSSPGAGKAAILDNKASIPLTDVTSGSVYTITDVKIYQLPFELQMTNRDTTGRFYDQLKITGYINTEPKFENYAFYYCPDFAKSAVNPDITQLSSSRPSDPTGISHPVYVRSARQLNALGRFAYYWSPSHWSSQKDMNFHFVQETDIDFGRYTTNYCGETISLMNTTSANPYRNKPIGHPNNQEFTDPNGNKYTSDKFRNYYDGRGNEIIDYCCVTTSADNFQFTGLFGQIHQAVLTNIVMVASDPDRRSGYIESSYNSSTKHPGVGALAGSVYAETAEEYSDIYSTISNCAVTGYTVVYNQPSPNSPVAVGGIAGYNFGKIENSSSICKLIRASTENGSETRYIGGISGSINGRGTISNCYSGGILASSAQINGTTYLGGICGGFDDISGAYDSNSNKNNRLQKITLSYSYCTFDENYISGTAYAAVNKTDQISVTECYYLTDTVSPGILLYGTEYVMAEDAAGLSQVLISNSTSEPAFGKASLDNTYPWSENLTGIAYPFPAVVKKLDFKDFVHYGDWHSEENPPTTASAVLDAQYPGGTVYDNSVPTETEINSNEQITP